jgi:hypothetical protein
MGARYTVWIAICRLLDGPWRDERPFRADLAALYPRELTRPSVQGIGIFGWIFAWPEK